MSKEQTKNNNVIRTKRSRFLSYFENMLKINASISVAFFAVCLVCIVLIFVLVQFSLTSRPIYYIPGANNAGYANPNEISEGSVIGFASSWVLNMMNFSPETIDVVHERAKRFMAPKLLSESRTVLDKELLNIKKASISSLFSLTNDPVLIEGDYGLSVIIYGDHGLYMGKSNIKLSSVKYTVYLKKVPPTEINPYGLLIKEVHKEESLKEEPS